MSSFQALWCATNLEANYILLFIYIHEVHESLSMIPMSFMINYTKVLVDHNKWEFLNAWMYLLGLRALIMYQIQWIAILYILSVFVTKYVHYFIHVSTKTIRIHNGHASLFMISMSFIINIVIIWCMYLRFL